VFNIRTLKCDYIKFALFEQAVSKNILEIDQPETRIAYGSHVC
jgi:hypothetical protein